MGRWPRESLSSTVAGALCGNRPGGPNFLDQKIGPSEWVGGSSDTTTTPGCPPTIVVDEEVVVEDDVVVDSAWPPSSWEVDVLASVVLDEAWVVVVVSAVVVVESSVVVVVSSVVVVVSAVVEVDVEVVVVCWVVVVAWVVDVVEDTVVDDTEVEVDDGSVVEVLVLESLVVDEPVEVSVVVTPPVRWGVVTTGVEVDDELEASFNEPVLPSSFAARAGPPGTVSATDSAPSSPDWAETDGKRSSPSSPRPSVKATKPMRSPVTPATANQCQRRSSSSATAEEPAPYRSGGGTISRGGAEIEGSSSRKRRRAPLAGWLAVSATFGSWTTVDQRRLAGWSGSTGGSPSNSGRPPVRGWPLPSAASSGANRVPVASTMERSMAGGLPSTGAEDAWCSAAGAATVSAG